MLTGKAKTDYMRNYMRKRRAQAKGAAVVSSAFDNAPDDRKDGEISLKDTAQDIARVLGERLPLSKLQVLVEKLMDIEDARVEEHNRAVKAKAAKRQEAGA